jgi:Leucine-rich repeat (LRR) protein
MKKLACNIVELVLYENKVGDTVISLSNNKLVNITISGHLKNLKELDISKNRLFTFFIPSTIDLHKLYLHDNNIVQLPSFCQNDGISKVPNLKALFLNGNALRAVERHRFYMP